MILKTTPWLIIFSGLFSCQSLELQTLLQKGNQLAQEGLYREAETQYQNILKQDSGHVLAQRNLGIVLVHLGLYKRAYKHLTQAYKSLPKDYQTNFYLAETYRVFRQYSSAIHHYSTALTLRSQDLRASRGLAWSYYHSKDYTKALQVLSSDTTEDTAVAIIRARIHLQLANFGAAASLMLAQLREGSKTYQPFILALLGDIYYARKDLEQAKGYYKQATTLKPHLPSALLGKAKIAYSEGSWEEAAKLLQRAVSIKKDLTEAYLYLGRVFQHSDPKKSLAYYRTYTRKLPRSHILPKIREELQESIKHLKQQLALEKTFSRF